jgi:hypothetical protein
VTLADGRTISDTAAYRVTLTDFLLTGGDGLGLGQSAISTEPLNIVDIDALIAYVGKLGGRVTGPAEPRLRAVGP